MPGRVGPENRNVPASLGQVRSKPDSTFPFEEGGKRGGCDFYGHSVDGHSGDSGYESDVQSLSSLTIDPKDLKDRVVKADSDDEGSLFDSDYASQTESVAGDVDSMLASQESLEVSVVRDSANTKQTIETLTHQLITVCKKVLPDTYRDYLEVNLQQALQSYKTLNSANESLNLVGWLRNLADNISERKGLKLLVDSSIGTVDKATLVSSCKQLSDLVRDYYHYQMATECKDRLKKAFANFQNPSTESFVRARVQAGFDVNVVSTDAGWEISSQILGCDDTKVRVFLNKKFSLRCNVGNDVAKGYAAGVLGRIDGRVFNNLDEFIDFYGDHLLLSLHKPLPGQHVKRDVIGLQWIKHHRKNVIASLPQFADNLKKMGIITPVDSLYYSYTPKEQPLAIKRRVTERHVGVRLLKAIGVDHLKIKWRNIFTRKVPLIKQLKAYPGWLQDYDKRCFNMAIPVNDGDKSQAYIKTLQRYEPDVAAQGMFEGRGRSSEKCYRGEKVISALERRFQFLMRVHALGADSVRGELESAQHLLRSLLEQNHGDYIVYCESVNRYRHTKKNRGAYRKRKAFEQLKGVKSPPEMLEGLMVTHARLSTLYEKINEKLNSVSKPPPWLQDIEASLEKPRIYINTADTARHLMLNKKAKGSIKYKQKLNKLALGPFEALVDIRNYKNKNEPNPDSDGDYLYVGLRLSMKASLSLIEDSVQKAFNDMMVGFAEQGELAGVASEGGISFDPVDGLDSFVQGMKHAKVEIYYVKGDDGKYHMQYMRGLGGEEGAIKGSGSAPVGGGANVSLKASADWYNYRFKKEMIGCETLTYVMTRYNGWRVGNQLGQWNAFLADKDHHFQLKHLMKNMANEKSNAREEFNNALQEARDYYAKKIANAKTSQEEISMVKKRLNSLDEASERWLKAFEQLEHSDEPEEGYASFYESQLTGPAKVLKKVFTPTLPETIKNYMGKKVQRKFEKPGGAGKKPFIPEPAMTPSFQQALTAMNDFLAVCHEPYLAKADSRFISVNPNA